MDIELFPAEKTCEQGCVHCPLARKNRNFTVAKKIDPRVQRSFNLVEKALRKKGMQYNLHTTSALHLFAKMDHPELIRMARFETGKEIRLKDGPKEFSKKIHEVLKKKGINPEIIGFSLVPKTPVVSEEDVETISAILNEIKKWHFQKISTSIEVTVRSNLIEVPLFQVSAPLLIESDNKYLGNMMKEHTNNISNTTNSPFFETSDAYSYFNQYLGEIDSRKITVSNRVIASKKISILKKHYHDQALEHAVRAKTNPAFAIAPKGVMMVHTSLAINNPILWITHKDFDYIINRCLKSRGFYFEELIKNTIIENSVLFDHIQREKGKQPLPMEYYMLSYELNRKVFEKNKRNRS